MDIQPLDHRDIQSLLDAAPLVPLLQTDAWAEFQTDYGRPVTRFAAIEKGLLVGVITMIEHQLMLGASYLYIPHGPVTASASAAEALLKAVIEHGRSRGVMYVKIDPPLDPGWKLPELFTPGTTLQPRDTAVLDLRKSEEELLAAMHQKTRYNIRVAQKRGVTIRWSTTNEDFQRFLQLQHAMSERQHIHLHPDNYYRKMFQAFQRHDMIQLAIAELDGTPLAINEIVVHGSVGTFLHGGSSDTQKEVMAPALLQWETIRWLKSKGLEWYDFRGIAPANQPHHHLAGVTRFKMGFGAEERTYPEGGNYVLQPSWYWAYRFAKRIRGGPSD